MLGRILAEFDNASGSLCSDEIAQRLGVEPALLSDMVDMLIGMGRLVEVHADDGCAACAANTLCLTRPQAQRAYLLAPDHSTP
jgi:hypothetical protein